MVYACGLTPAEHAVTIDQDGSRREGPVAPASPTELGGFWVVDAADDEEAYATAERGQEACGQRLEVRRVQG